MDIGGGNKPQIKVKEWLLRAREIDKEIALLQKTQQQAYDRIISTTAPLRDTPVSGGNSNRPFDHYIEFDQLINQKMDELYSVKKEILTVIMHVDRRELRQLLIDRYVNCCTWERIAASMNYSYIHVVKNLHPAALKAVKEYIEVYMPNVI